MTTDNDHDDDGNKVYARVQGKMADWNEKSATVCIDTNAIQKLSFRSSALLHLDLFARARARVLACDDCIYFSFSVLAHSSALFSPPRSRQGEEKDLFVCYVRARTIVSTKNATRGIKKHRWKHNLQFHCCCCCVCLSQLWSQLHSICDAMFFAYIIANTRCLCE